MAFRAGEAIKNGFEELKNYMIPRDISAEEKLRSTEKLIKLVELYGPVVSGYPSWHPLVTHHNSRDMVTTPEKRCGYEGLDHTRYLVNAFITCPYVDGQVIASVEKLKLLSSPFATICAERLDVKLYHPEAQPILVYCKWHKELPQNHMIPASLAVPLMLLKEVPCCTWSDVGETWESMRYNFLGSPHGNRSSLFVEQDTAVIMKKVWELLLSTGMYGPVKVTNY